jgi:hypothetical protein
MTRLRIQKVRKVAASAIFDRIKYHAPEAIIDVFANPADNGQSMVLHVNSGGNAIACEEALRREGFQVGRTGYDPYAPGHYGVQLRVWQP